MLKIYERLLNDGILKEHNFNAYINVVNMFERSNKVGIVHATGTGKSFIALQLMYDNSDKKIVYLVPRIDIGNQIEEHIAGLNKDARERYFKNVTIMTYQKLINMSYDELKEMNIDLLILDEFHHIGAPVWKVAIDELLKIHPNLKIFGMTATPIRYRGTSKQKNIADDFFDGFIASNYNLSQAIADGVLMPPIYKGAIYMLKEKLDEVKKRVEESNLSDLEKQEYIDKIEKAKRRVTSADTFSAMIRKYIKPNGKYIVFCPRGRREEYQKQSEEWFMNFIDEENIVRYFVDSKYSKESRINSSKFYNDYDSSKLRLMFAMDMYIEGIHVPDIDGIIMMRPTKSDIMFYQMLGRALSSNKNNHTLVLDFVNNYEYIVKLKDATIKTLLSSGSIKSNSNGSISDVDELPSFSIDLENIDILNMLESINDKLDLSFDQKIAEFIEMINDGYIPKCKDIKKKFSNGDYVNTFWKNNSQKILEVLNNDVRYKDGYERARQILSCILVKKVKPLSIDEKIAEYIEMIKNGYIPKTLDKETHFSNKFCVGAFWFCYRDRIIDVLNNDERYRNGYEEVKRVIKNLLIDKISEYIEMINNGYIPKYRDTETQFSNGDFINTFLSNNIKKILDRLNNDVRYKYGYDKARWVITDILYKKSLTYDKKIYEFIEMLNNGYIPKNEDKVTQFSNGDYINTFWQSSRDKVIEILSTDLRYQEGYDCAKGVIARIMRKKEMSLTLDEKISEYIEMLNNGYIPKRDDKVTQFSNGDYINTFWRSHCKKIFDRLKNDLMYGDNYRMAKKIVFGIFEKKLLSTDEKIYEFIEMLNNGYIPKSEDKVTQFSNGDYIGQFWSNKQDRIIDVLNTDRYNDGYERAKNIISSILDKREKKLTTDEKIYEFIEMLNSGYIPKSEDKETQFSNGDYIGQFWKSKKNAIIERLNDLKYEYGYELAKKICEIMLLPSAQQRKVLKELKQFLGDMNNGDFKKKLVRN